MSYPPFPLWWIVLLIVMVPFVRKLPRTETGEKLKFATQISSSGAIILTALVVILSHRYTVQDKNWAFGSLGTVVGFWLPK
jgi:hypothetical protein